MNLRVGFRVNEKENGNYYNGSYRGYIRLYGWL